MPSESPGSPISFPLSLPKLFRFRETNPSENGMLVTLRNSRSVRERGGGGGWLETPVLGEAPCDSALGSPLTEGEASLDPPPRPKPADTSAQGRSFLPGFSPGLTGSLPRGRSEAEAAGDGDSSSDSSSRGRNAGPEAMAESGPSCTQARTRLWLSALDPNSGEGLSEKGPGLPYGQQLGGAQLGLRPGGEKKKGVAGGYRKLQMPRQGEDCPGPPAEPYERRGRPARRRGKGRDCGWRSRAEVLLEPARPPASLTLEETETRRGEVTP